MGIEAPSARFSSCCFDVIVTIIESNYYVLGQSFYHIERNYVSTTADVDVQADSAKNVEGSVIRIADRARRLYRPDFRPRRLWQGAPPCEARTGVCVTDRSESSC